MARKIAGVLRNFTGLGDSEPDFMQEVAPPARMVYLIGADSYVLAAGFCYCQPALMYDGRDADADTKRFTLITPPGALHARAWITRFTTGPVGAALGDIELDSTTTGSDDVRFRSRPSRYYPAPWNILDSSKGRGRSHSG